MKRTIKGHFAVILLFLSFLLQTSPLEGKAEGRQPALDKDYGRRLEAKDIRREISLFNLYNGLNLSKKQAQALKGLARSARRMRDDYFGRDSQRYDEILGAYEKIRQVVSKGKAIPGYLEGLGGMMELAEKRLMKEYLSELARLERRVVTLLSPAQRKIVQDFDPCLIPPKNLKSPVNVGQAGGEEHGLEILEKIRELPREGFERNCKRLLELHISGLEKFLGPMEPDLRQREMKRMLQVCQRVAELSGVEFALQGDSLARELDIERQKTRLKAKAEEFYSFMERIRGGRIGKFAKHFLDPLVIRVLDGMLMRAESKETRATEAESVMDGLQPKGKYGIDELSKALGLEGRLEEKFFSIMSKAKLKHMKMLQKPLDDGATILSHMIEIQSKPEHERKTAAAELHERLREVAPGENHSPLEKLMRLKATLHRRIRKLLGQRRYEALIGQVPELLDKVELGNQSKKRRASELFRKLSLDFRQRKAFYESLRSGQVESYRLLSTPTNDGEKPLDLIMKVQSSPAKDRERAKKRFARVMKKRVPGGSSSYAEAVEKIKARVVNELKSQLSHRQRRVLASLDLDVLEIKLDD